MTRVELSKLARLDLDHLISTREVPAGEAWAHVWSAIDQLERHPESGQLVAGRRYFQPRMLGVAWGWLCLLYLYDEAEDVVSVTTFYDGRTLGAPHP